MCADLSHSLIVVTSHIRLHKNDLCLSLTVHGLLGFIKLLGCELMLLVLLREMLRRCLVLWGLKVLRGGWHHALVHHPGVSSLVRIGVAGILSHFSLNLQLHTQR